MSIDRLEEQLRHITERLHRLDGALLATTAAVRGLIASHPEPRKAAESVIHMLEHLSAQGLGSEVQDALIAGIEEGRQALIPPAWRDLLKREPR